MNFLQKKKYINDFNNKLSISMKNSGTNYIAVIIALNLFTKRNSIDDQYQYIKGIEKIFIGISKSINKTVKPIIMALNKPERPLPDKSPESVIK